MAYDPHTPHLIGLVEAMAWTGRPAGTLHRWASEGRITRHGSGRTSQWDWHELPCAGSGIVPPRRAGQAA